jgi:hypothetical protein
LARALTDSTIKGIKPPPAGRVEVADLRCAGLSFRVTAAGIRSWSFRFRDPQSGKDARSTIGHYPDVSLGAAREAADALRGKVAKGVNPSKTADRPEARKTNPHQRRRPQRLGSKSAPRRFRSARRLTPEMKNPAARFLGGISVRTGLLKRKSQRENLYQTSP